MARCVQDSRASTAPVVAGTDQRWAVLVRTQETCKQKKSRTLRCATKSPANKQRLAGPALQHLNGLMQLVILRILGFGLWLRSILLALVLQGYLCPCFLDH